MESPVLNPERVTLFLPKQDQAGKTFANLLRIPLPCQETGFTIHGRIQISSHGATTEVFLSPKDPSAMRFVPINSLVNISLSLLSERTCARRNSKVKMPISLHQLPLHLQPPLPTIPQVVFSPRQLTPPPLPAPNTVLKQPITHTVRKMKLSRLPLTPGPILV